MSGGADRSIVHRLKMTGGPYSETEISPSPSTSLRSIPVREAPASDPSRSRSACKDIGRLEDSPDFFRRVDRRQRLFILWLWRNDGRINASDSKEAF
jgi:hypothetical protein